jgi:hypothetical protein
LKKDERGDLHADHHKFRIGGRITVFVQLLNEHGMGDVRQTKMHTAEPFSPQPSAYEVDANSGKLEKLQITKC